MPEKDLDTRFQEAVELADSMTQADLPQDIQLRLYAFYKQATSGTPATNYGANADLRNAFKTNAWMQISNMTPDQAKESYIALILSLAKNNK